jgi:hypothetical protein
MAATRFFLCRQLVKANTGQMQGDHRHQRPGSDRTPQGLRPANAPKPYAGFSGWLLHPLELSRKISTEDLLRG